MGRGGKWGGGGGSTMLAKMLAMAKKNEIPGLGLVAMPENLSRPQPASLLIGEVNASTVSENMMT